MLKWIWPSIQDFKDCRKAAGMGAGTAFLVAVVTGVITWMSQHGHELFKGLNASSYIDAIIFMAAGFGITKMSRVAAIAGLLVYVYGQYETAKMLAAQGEHYRFFVPVLFTLNFVNGIRGTFAFHELKKVSSEAEEREIKGAAAEESGETAKMRHQRIRAWIILLSMIVATGAVWASMKISAAKLKVDQDVFLQSDEPVIPAKRNPPKVLVPRPGDKTFYLKSGQTVRGKVVFEDEVYYSVETSGGQEIVIKQDLDPSKPPA